METIKSVFSPSQHAIYPSQFYESYKRSGTWPADGIAISDEDAIKFNGVNQPTGKMVDYIDGELRWIDRPEPQLTKEQLITIAEQKKLSLRIAADTEINWRQDAIDAGIATDAETTALTAWKKYRVLLMRVDTSSVPDIEWPTAPDQ